MRAFIVAAVLPALFTVLIVTGCAPSDPPAEKSETLPTTVGEVVEEQPVAVSSFDAASERTPDFEALVGVWLLEDLAGQGVIGMAQTTLEFDGEGGASGSGGCNRYTGSYTFEGGRLEFEPMAGTKMMCPEAVMDQEDRFHDALADTEGVTIDGDLLLIEITGSAAPLKFTRMAPDVID